MTSFSRPTHWGLAVKLFAILTLLGAVAVLVTGVLGYFRARDALEQAVFDQLTTCPSDQGTPGRDLLPHDQFRIAPSCQLQDGGRRDPRVPDRGRQTRPG